MAKKAPKRKRKKQPYVPFPKTVETKRKIKLQMWLAAFLDESNPKTFLNKKESARAAGYVVARENTLAVQGWKNFHRMGSEINKWLDEMGLSDVVLKAKLLQLLNARETKFVNITGTIKTETLDPSCRVVAEASQEKLVGKDATPYDEESSVLAIDTEAQETQRRTLDMALKVKGMYAADEIKVTGLEGLAERLTRANERAGKS
jgi:hypothetical protein